MGTTDTARGGVVFVLDVSRRLDENLARTKDKKIGWKVLRVCTKRSNIRFFNDNFIPNSIFIFNIRFLCIVI